MCAARNGNMEAIKEFLAHGAKVNIRSASGYTPLMGAACRGNCRVVLMLLEHGAYIDDQNFSERTALWLAASNNSLNVARVLLNFGANADVCDKSGLSFRDITTPDLWDCAIAAKRARKDCLAQYMSICGAFDENLIWIILSY
jgi:ankyrin repeat protein